MLPINQNMIVSQALELILSVFRRTTISDQQFQHISFDLGMGPIFSKLFNPLLKLKYNGSRGLNNFEKFGPIPKLMDADLI